MLYPKTIYRQSDYLKTLEKLGFNKGCKRVKFERLKIPSSGYISIKVIYEKEAKEDESVIFEILFEVEKTIKELKAAICKQL